MISATLCLPMQNALTIQTHNFQLSDPHRADVIKKFERVVNDSDSFMKVRVTLEGVYPTNTTVLYAARAVVEIAQDELYIERVPLPYSPQSAD